MRSQHHVGCPCCNCCNMPLQVETNGVQEAHCTAVDTANVTQDLDPFGPLNLQPFCGGFEGLFVCLWRHTGLPRCNGAESLSGGFIQFLVHQERDPPALESFFQVQFEKDSLSQRWRYHKRIEDAVCVGLDITFLPEDACEVIESDPKPYNLDEATWRVSLAPNVV